MAVKKSFQVLSDLLVFNSIEPTIETIPTDGYDAKKELGLSWELEDANDEGEAVVSLSDNIVYCIVTDCVKRLTVLHEALHCINFIYTCINAVVDVENDEIYVRNATWLQDAVLTEWEDYYNKLVLKN